MIPAAPTPEPDGSWVVAEDVTVRFGDQVVLQQVDVRLQPGRLTALIGPNGAGKSTLFSVLSGDLAPTSGRVRLGGRELAGYRPKELARARAVLPQEHLVRFSYAVHEVVAMARLAHPVDPGRDECVVAEALRAAEVTHLRDRDVQTLSGGEMARTTFARVLAQTTPVLFLDEPTAALDLRHQESLLRHARELREQGYCVVVVLHDLNLAAAYADRVVMMDRGRVVADGTPAEVLTASRIGEVYDQPVLVLAHPTRDCPLVVPVDPAPAPVGATTPVPAELLGHPG